MATIISDNIISPLGFSSEETYRAVVSGTSALHLYESDSSIPFKYTASRFTPLQNSDLHIDGFTRFESLAIKSISAALANVDIPLDDSTVLIICSTKGNVELLGKEEINQENILLGNSARHISETIGFSTSPIVVCNACISGVSGLILGNRLIDSGKYKHAVICGIDLQNQFVISGFQSLKALSETMCRPFDIERTGLNLGEAAATMILGEENGGWRICAGAVNNDAHHITNPSPLAQGSVLSLQQILKETTKDNVAVINAHGTATMFNDQMESKAIDICGLSDIPANALKGYLGHTMGAAGVIETILTMKALQEGIVLGTKGFEEPGVSGKINISNMQKSSDKKDFIKIISGFGGGNGAILISCDDAPGNQDCSNDSTKPFSTNISHKIRITPDTVFIDGEEICHDSHGLALLTELYKRYVKDYPKFYKMDPLARLGFVATEILLSRELEQNSINGKRGIVFFNTAGSIHADREYLKTISDINNFFPSPSLFVYTLPNIVTGEIALCNKYHGETAFYILPEKEDERIKKIIDATFEDDSLESLIAGWLEYKDENNFEADLYIINKTTY